MEDFFFAFGQPTLRGQKNIEMLHFYKPLTAPRSYGKKHFKAAG